MNSGVKVVVSCNRGRGGEKNEPNPNSGVKILRIVFGFGGKKNPHQMVGIMRRISFCWAGVI